MSEPRIPSYREFWPYYVGEHKKPLTRWLHFVGTTGVFLILISAIVTMRPWMLLLCPLSGYSWAWVSHFFVEKNRPATFKYPLWSLTGDFQMYFFMITGRMNAEVERVAAGKATPAAASQAA
ncbi:MAG: Mpo1-like protein [Myxococcaceae bacterium]